MNSASDTLAGGLPHSEIPGSTIARISPGLFAACHVLHRLLVPRHPPNALLMLEITPAMHRSHPHPIPSRRRDADSTATAGLSTHATLIHPLARTTSIANASERPCCCRGQPDPAHAKPAYRSDLRPQRAQRRTRTIFTLTKTTPGHQRPTGRPARTPTARRPLRRAENAPKPEPLRRQSNPLSTSTKESVLWAPPPGDFLARICCAAAWTTCTARKWR